MTDGRRKLRMLAACDNRLSDMERRDDGRWCPECERVVVDLRHATEREALAKLERAGGTMCAWIRPDREGRAIFRREPVTRRATLGAAALSVALAGCEPATEAPPREPAVQHEAPPPETAPTPEPEPTAERGHPTAEPETPAPESPPAEVLPEPAVDEETAEERDAHAHHRHRAHHEELDPIGGLVGL